jgi:1-deoxy-D-xylulose 5-phosphate reductoisomerase
MNFEYQANQIKTFVNSHNVIHIGIDITGMGIGVFELVECFYPMATPIHYSVENKNRLVLKALDVINNGRFKFLTQDTEVIRSFMMITRTTSTNGVVIYSSPRNKESGHADAAWSIMHAMAYESIRPQQQTTVTFGH